MIDITNWDWTPGKKALADLDEIKKRFPTVHEYSAAPDGERIAVPVKLEDGTFSACVNGDLWPETYELLWYLRFSPAGKLIALVRIDDEWTLAGDAVAWEERFEYAWNPRFSLDGRSVGMMYKRDNMYGISIDGKVWDESFHAMRDFCLSDDGARAAATVQVAPLGEADVFEFFKGVWSVAVDSKPWPEKFINTWSPRFSTDGKHVVSEVRTDICDYTIAVDSKPWPASFGCVWQPIFKPNSDSVVAPVRHKGNWTLAEDGNLLWDGRYAQLWGQKFSSDGKRLAAIVSLDYGEWTIAVDNVPWKKRFDDMVLDPHFSPDGSRIAAIVKQDNRWTICSDGIAWDKDFDMIWDPVFSPSGEHIAVKAESAGKYNVVIDGRVAGADYDQLWDPVFNTDGDKLLLRYVKDGKFVREVCSFAELLG